MPKNNVKAIFYCGTNGAGKSTLRQFNHDSVNIIIDSDHIAKEINPNNPRAADIQAGKKALRLYQQAIKEPTSFSMESTLFVSLIPVIFMIIQVVILYYNLHLLKM
nr:hypothetical protein [Testudinibacter sp. TR-2022]